MSADPGEAPALPRAGRATWLSVAIVSLAPGDDGGVAANRQHVVSKPMPNNAESDVGQQMGKETRKAATERLRGGRRETLRRRLFRRRRILQPPRTRIRCPKEVWRPVGHKEADTIHGVSCTTVRFSRYAMETYVA
jgi:hypothetical protein